MARSLCGSFLANKRSLVAFTWTITTVLTFVAFIVALVMVMQIHTHYIRLERFYEQQLEYQQQYENNNNGNGGDGQDQGSLDRQIREYQALSQITSSSMTFVGVYVVLLGLTLNLYGSTAIVGFTSLRGDYIGPCFSSPSFALSRLKVGIFGGANVVFANVLLVCAAVLGEVRVSRKEKEYINISQKQMLRHKFGMYSTLLYLFLLYHRLKTGRMAEDMKSKSAMK